MTDESHSRTEHLLSFVNELFALVIEEWESRTVYGKVFFPYWLLVSTLMWTAVLSIVFLVRVARWYIDVLGGGADRQGLLPEVYKDDR
jgi:hypothetical protein